MDRVKQLTAGSYSFSTTAVDEDGETITVTAPLSARVLDGSGATVATGTPTASGDQLTLDVPAVDMPLLDTYTIEWTGQHDAAPRTWTSQVELVGGFLFEIAQFRRFDNAFLDTAKYPTEAIRLIRTYVEDQIEGHKAAAVAFVPRARRAVLDGDGDRSIFLPDLEAREVLSLTSDDTVWTQQQITDGITVDDGMLWLNGHGAHSIWKCGRRNVRVHYTHGLDSPPGPIRRAALLLAKEYAVQADVPARATATSVGDQLFRLTVAGRDGVTGIPDVDAAIDQWGRKPYRIG